MQVLVTGAAGFVGSNAVDALLARGDVVRGVDCFLDYYPRAAKERNLSAARANPRFEFVETDLVTGALERLLDGVDAVLHFAAQAGVRASWGRDFRIYADVNVLGTQRLLEACAARHPRFVYSSTSSIYGDAPDLPTVETTLPRPVSPYGVTKLAGEHLCRLYAQSAGVPTVSLRYFTVYGPRQRPDMAFHRFVRAHLVGHPVTVYDDGDQTRDGTGTGTNDCRPAISNSFNDHPAEDGGRCRNKRVDRDEAHLAHVPKSLRSGVESKPPDPQHAGTNEGKYQVSRIHSVHTEAFSRTNHSGGN